MGRSRSSALGRLRWVCLWSLVACGVPCDLMACTTAVISGKATADGRPLLWKTRDTRTTRLNEVVVYEGEKFRVLAVVNAGRRDAVWMGVNSAGLCIENSLSRDLGPDGQAVPEGDPSPADPDPATGSKRGLGNGGIMKTALETCATVEDFRRLLERTDAIGRVTNANFGVIDASGGAALFETGHTSFRMFDANDPTVAPRGYIVRSNFATTARGIGPMPGGDLVEGSYSGERYARACDLLDGRPASALEVGYLLRQVCRDLASADGEPIPGTVNGPAGDLPEVVDTSATISRATTVSAAVFHGVRSGEDPLATTMWVALGDPKFSITVPCWVGVQEVTEALAGEHGGEICSIANTLREWTLARDQRSVRTAELPQIWEDVWPVEERMLAIVADWRRRWLASPPDAAEVTELHRHLATLALDTMREELADMKEAALTLPAPPPVLKPVRVAIYDAAPEVSKGPRNLLRFLSAENGFSAHRVTAEQIRAGCLDEVDVLIMPGGSGSKQAAQLEAEGRLKIQDFVRAGGGYVGICAGSYLATTHYDWSLGLINAQVWDRAHWARGGGEVTLRMSDAGGRLLGRGGSVDVHYNQGPLLVPDDEAGLPGYQVLATFETEIAEKGAPAGVMTGTHAIIRSTFGEGRVICYSPHPEVSDGPNSLVAAGVAWAGKGDVETARDLVEVAP